MWRSLRLSSCHLSCLHPLVKLIRRGALLRCCFAIEALTGHDKLHYGQSRGRIPASALKSGHRHRLQVRDRVSAFWRASLAITMQLKTKSRSSVDAASTLPSRCGEDFTKRCVAWQKFSGAPSLFSFFFLASCVTLLLERWVWCLSRAGAKTVRQQSGAGELNLN
jgi:hypothetical protein